MRVDVLTRLRALYEPIVDDFGNEYTFSPEPLGRVAMMRPIRLPSTILAHIITLSAAFSLPHVCRRLQAAMRAAIMVTTPEMKWFRDVPGVKNTGKAMRRGTS